MSFLAQTKIRNGVQLVRFDYFKCDRCGCELPENVPKYSSGGINYCMDCGLILGVVSNKEWLDGSPICLDSIKVGVNPYSNEIEVAWEKAKFSWEKSDRDYRHSQQYSNWRTAVFQRDGYTCQACGVVGGELNAHHIKTYAKHKELRFDTSNGITLCQKCHRNAHKKVV